MTNLQIIANAAIEAGLYTLEQVEACFAAGHQLPLHTFAEWKRLGYIVKRGEKSKLAVDIWMKSNKKITAETKDGEEIEADAGRFYRKLSHFFTLDQVERLPA